MIMCMLAALYSAEPVDLATPSDLICVPSLVIVAALQPCMAAATRVRQDA